MPSQVIRLEAIATRSKKLLTVHQYICSPQNRRSTFRRHLAVWWARRGCIPRLRSRCGTVRIFGLGHMSLFVWRQGGRISFTSMRLRGRCSPLDMAVFGADFVACVNRDVWTCALLLLVATCS